MPNSDSYNFSPIGIIHSCYKEKFGIPRQPGLVTEAVARLELTPPYNRMDTLEGLSDFSHMWIQFVFHANQRDSWKAKVRPPRLGGQKKLGVFATRGTYRPNPIGLSVVKIQRIYKKDSKIFIDIEGADLLDGTPVLDIKPYLPYADSIPEAKGGFAHNKSPTHEVRFSATAKQQCERYETKNKTTIIKLIEQVIAQDPRPSYLDGQIGREHGIRLRDINIKWCARSDHFEVLHIETGDEVNL